MVGSIFFGWLIIKGEIRRDLVDRIISATPPDPSDEESSLHVQLFQGEPSRALDTADKIDPWLSAHLADMMLPLGLLTSEVNEQ